MKYLFSSALILFFFSAPAQLHQLHKLWETDSVIAVPESVLPHKDILLISLIDGAPWEADGRGGVATLSTDGKVYNGKWLTGLSAPKGMGIAGDALYIADLSDVVVVNINDGTIKKRIAIPGAKGLNDITITGSGSVFVSDSHTGKIWKLDSDVPQMFMDSVTGVNGLKAVGENLVVAGGKNFFSVQPNKTVTKIADLPQGGDGIEPIGNGDYLVTSWSGFVFYVHSNGQVETLLDTSKEKRNTADIGYDPVKRIVYVPTFNAKTIVAYHLQ